MKKKIFILLAVFMASILTFVAFAYNIDRSVEDTSKIKSTVEDFVKTSYNSSGISVPNKDLSIDNTFKEYLDIRNEFVLKNNKKSDFLVKNVTYQFDFKDIEQVNEIIYLRVYIKQDILYEIQNKKDEKAIHGDDMVVYMKKESPDKYTILSAFIFEKQDYSDIPSDENVNIALGYDLYRKNKVQLLIYDIASRIDGRKLSISPEKAKENIKKIETKMKDSFQ